MNAILYPVAANAEQAFSRPMGRAAREREAGVLAGEPVAFTTQAVGPAFATRDAALSAYPGRVDDERSGSGPAPQDRYCRLAEQVVGGPPEPARPSFEAGRRWPKPPAHPPRTVWRMQISFWRLRGAEAAAEMGQARQARRGREAQTLDAAQLRALAAQPLQPVKPQQPLDIGLFETRLPEAPHIVVPDE